MGTRDTKGAGHTAIPRGKAEGGEWKNAAVRALHEVLTERVRRHSRELGSTALHWAQQPCAKWMESCARDEPVWDDSAEGLGSPG